MRFILTLVGLILSIVVNLIVNPAYALPENYRIVAPVSVSKLNQIKIHDDFTVAWSQVCSCISYSGVPHTCYYSSYTDPYYSCIAKCVREANQ